MKCSHDQNVQEFNSEEEGDRIMQLDQKVSSNKTEKRETGSRR